MSRLLIIPAAGRGSRLGRPGAKVLCPVGGRPMIDHLLDRYRGLTDAAVVVCSLSAVDDVRRHLQVRSATDCVVQAAPTGMLPALLCAKDAVARSGAESVWITWCDQVGISDDTAARLAAEQDGSGAALVFPTVRQTPPYVHYQRDDAGRIVGVLTRRDGHAMPPHGESDAGLFALTSAAYLHELVEYDRLARFDDRTVERNFLPFIPWLAARASVHTFPISDSREAIGVNTPEDLAVMEAYLRERR